MSIKKIPHSIFFQYCPQAKIISPILLFCSIKIKMTLCATSIIYIMTLLLDIKGTVHCNTDSLRMCKGLKLTDWNRCRTNCDVSINFSPLYINIISLIHLHISAYGLGTCKILIIETAVFKYYRDIL